jgi:glucose 1-dehydrogenase
MTDAGRLTGKATFVTGAATGIGRGIAERFADEGASVVFADRDEAGLAEVAGSDRVVAMAVDIGDAHAVQAALDTTVERFGGLDVVVNNAAIIRYGNFLDLTLEEWEDVLRVNVTGTFIVAQAAARHMIALGSEDGAMRSMVNIGSVEGRRVLARTGHPQVHYGTSKAAVHQLTDALAVELAPHRIRVNSICPGLVRTSFTAEVLSRPDTASWFLDRVPLGRAGEPAEIAAAAVFLASEEASYVTGASLAVDGGWMTA